MSSAVHHIELNNEQLRKLQNEMLILLTEVDRICRKHNISYYIGYGTLIGAVRHQGYIPWDDDVDIEMPRADYDRFFEVCKAELDNKRFFVQNQKTDKHYNWVFGKLKLKNTSYVRSGQEHLKQQDGIFIDIFPLDNISSNKLKQKMTLFACKVCRKVLWAPVGKKVMKKPKEKILYTLLSWIPRGFTSAVFEFFAKLDNDKDTQFLASYNYASGYVFEKEWFEPSIELEFEKQKFFAPNGYHHSLSMIYGNYMSVPPVEKQQGNSYASYIKFSDSTEVKL